MTNIFLGYLSWKSPKNLKKSLETHRNNGLHDMICKRVIYFNEISQEDIEIASEYNCEYIGTTANIGIGLAKRELLKLCIEGDYEMFCFIECDFHMNVNSIDIFSECIDLIKEGIFDYVYLRDGRDPGMPFGLYGERRKSLQLGHGLLPHLWHDRAIKYAEYLKTDLNMFAICSSRYQKFSNQYWKY